MVSQNNKKGAKTKKEYYRKNRKKILKKKRDYYQKNKEKILKRMLPYSKQWYQKNIKRLRIEHKKYYRNNKVKVQRYHRYWYLENKEEFLKKSRDYYAKNRERVSCRHRNYNRKNKDRLLDYKIEWQKNRRRISPRYRLDENMGSAIARALQGKKNGQEWEKLVDYSLEKLMIHLERRFDELMNWNNYGNYWAVDHVKPKSLFNYDSPKDLEFKKCWTLDNLQPLSKIENIKKRNHYING